MCGISGYINLDDKPIRDTSSILRMLFLQKHRGPDDSGVMAFCLKFQRSQEYPVGVTTKLEESYNGVIGFNRLSILDLSSNGHQPMIDKSEKVILAMNGEIYNAFDYKNDLLSSGFTFKSTTDTEVVLYLYIKYGIEGLLKRINGMFALSIIDLNSGVIYLARDRFGVKPMNYIFSDKLLAFSSEIKSFYHLEGFKYLIDNSQLDEYLIFRYNLNKTLYKGVQKLKPGHYLKYSTERRLEEHCYFDINDLVRNNNSEGDLNTFTDKLESWLSESVKSQMLSDVKLGCQLSGGIDSSIVSFFANKYNTKGNFESVSILFKNANYSEEKYIDKVAGLINILPHKFVLKSDYFFENISKGTWHFEAPLNHPNTLAIYLLSQKAKEHVTVLLSGEGADELFGGYRHFYNVTYPYQLNVLFQELKRGRYDLLKLISYLNPEKRAVMPTAYMPINIAEKIMPSFNLNNAINGRMFLYNSLMGSTFDKQVKYEFLTYLPDLLLRQDKMSMAHSIENRVPFLDNDLVNYTFQIPEKFLSVKESPNCPNTEKYLLKKVASKVFGNEFAFRKKMGFSIPIREFINDRIFLQYLRDCILPGIKSRGYFNNLLIKRWIDNLNSINYQELDSLWIIIAFEVWAQIFLDGKNENWDTPF